MLEFVASFMSKGASSDKKASYNKYGSRWQSF
jgi:hypothetical protein